MGRWTDSRLKFSVALSWALTAVPAQAQLQESIDASTALADKINKSGLVYYVLLVSFALTYALIKLYRDLRKCELDRITEQKTLASVLHEAAISVNSNTAAHQAAERASDAQRAAYEGMKASLDVIIARRY